MKKCILFSAFAIFTSTIYATTHTWLGGNGNYTTLNWSTDGGSTNCTCTPTSSDDLEISSGEVTINTTEQVIGVKVDGTGTLKLDPSAVFSIILSTGTGLTLLEIDGAAASVIVQATAMLVLDSTGGTNSIKGLHVHSGGTFINRGQVEMSIPDAFFQAAVYIEDISSEFRNNATGCFLLKISNTRGIKSLGTFLNAGQIKIDKTGSDGIELRGPGTNNGTIEIENAGGNGFATLNDFTNTSAGEIYIGSRDGIKGIIEDIGFTSQVSGVVLNQGLIQIDHFGNSGTDGMIITIPNFTNEGNIDITHSSTNEGIVMVASNITNTACANIRSRSPFFVGNTALLTNEGNIFLDTAEPSMIFATAGINGEIINNGQIEDFQGSFNLSSSFFNNNGLVLQPISGTYQLNQTVPNFLQGSGIGITVGTDITLDAAGTNIIGNYNGVSNEFVATNTDAICEDTFYIELDDGNGCIVVMKIKFENPIIPDPINAGEIFNIKLFLQGPFDTGTNLMSDDLRVAGLIPNTDPYLGSQTISDPTVLDDKGNDSIVDWVLVEITTVSDPSTILVAVPLLLQRDGDVVTRFGGVPNLALPQMCATYYLRLRHRNHLGAAVMFERTF